LLSATLGYSLQLRTQNDDGSQVQNPTVYASTATFRIGAYNTTPAGFWNGRIDAVGYWTRVLTASERASLYSNGSGCEYPFTTCPAETTTTYTYASAHKHAVTSLSTGETYTYDPNGNMTSRTETVNGVLTSFAQNFDAENRLTSVLPTPGSVATSFKYDGDGNLVAKLFGNVTTYYVGGVYEVEVTNTTVTKQTWYYPVGGAMRIIDGTGNNVYYLLKDHLGSGSVLLDSSGELTPNGEQRYYPFGESRIANADVKTDQLFTGQRQVANIGLYHYGARMYDPYLNHWIQPDTIVPEPGNPQTLNRYAFVNNNPVNATDPTGHEACYDTGVEIGSGISQADCWAYGRDKWIYGWDVAAPVAGRGYNTLDGLIGGSEGESFTLSQEALPGTKFNQQFYDLVHSKDPSEALDWIASRLHIKLPPGIRWILKSIITPGVAGWNPTLFPVEKRYTGLFVSTEYGFDNAVYIDSGFVEDMANYDPDFVAAVMIHEARHAWREYFGEQSGGGSGGGAFAEIDADYAIVEAVQTFNVNLSDAAQQFAKDHLNSDRQRCLAYSNGLSACNTVNHYSDNFGPEFGQP
jgi:RHS repeat-associated protein